MNNTVFSILLAVFFVLAIASLVFTFSKCGYKTFFLGSGAIFAAAAGMCD